MTKPKLRNSLVRVATLSAAGVAALTMIGSGVASAIPADPPGGATPVPPAFNNGNVEGIRNSGSDTTFFLMQRMSDLYTGAGLYGCTLNTGAGQTLYNSSDPASSTANQQDFCQSGKNIDTTDTADNWNRTEVTTGVDDVGSGAGQNQLCNAINSPLPVDFARSSKPITGACATEAQTGFAKDSVPATDWTNINPSTFGTSTFTSTSAPYSSINGGNVGPVTLGWLPGDPVGGPYTGTPFTNLTNNDSGGGASSVAFRLWCVTGGNQISDWGQLTNLGPNLQVPNVTENSTATVTISGNFPTPVAGGQAVSGPNIPGGTTVASVSGGTLTLSQAATGNSTSATLVFATGATQPVGSGGPIGVPVHIMGVNSASGTEATFASFANGGVASNGCVANMNRNAWIDPNPATATGTNATAHIALENNSSQVSDFAALDFPGDFVDQAIEVSTTLYIMSNGAYNSNPFAAAAEINGISFSGTKLTENGQSPTTPKVLGNIYPTARTMFNIYRTDTVRASTAGFLNWICDANVNFLKGKDNSTGLNFDSELQTLINTTFQFVRLNDASPAAAILTPADNLPAPNDACQAPLLVNTNTDTTLSLASGTFPVDIVGTGLLANGGSVTVTGPGIPAGTTVVSNNGSTLTLSQATTATATGVSVEFGGVPAITKVANPQT